MSLLRAPHETVSHDWFRSQDAGTRREVLEELAERGRDDDIELMIASLRDDNPGVQQAAVSGLVHVGGDAVVHRLVGLLREPPAIRNMAVEVIDELVLDGLESLLPVLESPDPDVRKFIVDAFGKHDDPRLIAPLLKLLKDASPNVRAATAEALGHLRARDAVAGLIRLLDDEEWVAFSAIGALAEIGDPSALGPVLALIAKGREAVTCAAIEAIPSLDQQGSALPMLVDFAASISPDLRPALIKTLVAVAERTGSDIWSRVDRNRWLGILTETLSADDPETRAAAMSALGLLGDPSSAGPILDMYACLEQPTDEVADRAVQALVGTGNIEELVKAVEREDERTGKIAIRALGVLRAAEAVPVLAQVRRTSADWDMRRLAIKALGLIGTDDALDYLDEAVEDQTGYVRREAVHLLGDCRRETSVRALFARLKVERYQEVRDEIADTLVRIGTQPVMIELVRLLQNARPEVRESGARAIGKARLPEGLDALIDAMNDPDARVRKSVVEAIGRYFDARALPPLLLALSDTDEKVRLAAVIGVAGWKTPEARKALLSQGLRDTDAWVRHRAVERVGLQRVAEAVPALAALLAAPREPGLVKRAAVAALGAIGGAEARAALLGCLAHDEPDIRNAAAQALERAEPEAR